MGLHGHRQNQQMGDEGCGQRVEASGPGLQPTSQHSSLGEQRRGLSQTNSQACVSSAILYEETLVGTRYGELTDANSFPIEFMIQQRVDLSEDLILRGMDQRSTLPCVLTFRPNKQVPRALSNERCDSAGSNPHGTVRTSTCLFCMSVQ